MLSWESALDLNGANKNKNIFDHLCAQIFDFRGVPDTPTMMSKRYMDLFEQNQMMNWDDLPYPCFHGDPLSIWTGTLFFWRFMHTHLRCQGGSRYACKDVLVSPFFVHSFILGNVGEKKEWRKYVQFRDDFQSPLFSSTPSTHGTDTFALFNCKLCVETILESNWSRPFMNKWK